MADMFGISFLVDIDKKSRATVEAQVKELAKLGSENPITIKLEFQNDLVDKIGKIQSRLENITRAMGGDIGGDMGKAMGQAASDAMGKEFQKNSKVFATNAEGQIGDILRATRRAFDDMGNEVIERYRRRGTGVFVDGPNGTLNEVMGELQMYEKELISDTKKATDETNKQRTAEEKRAWAIEKTNLALERMKAASRDALLSAQSLEARSTKANPNSAAPMGAQTQGVSQLVSLLETFEATAGMSNVQMDVLKTSANQIAVEINKTLGLMKQITLEEENTVKAEQNRLNKLEKTRAELQNVLRQAEAADAIINKYRDEGGRKESARSKLSELEGISIPDDATIPDMEKSLRQARALGTELNSMGKEARAAGRGALEMGDMFQNAWRSLGVYFGTYQLFMQTIQVIKDGVQAVKDLDAALVDLSKVTPITRDQFRGVYEEAANIGVAIGRSGTEVVAAAADFARMNHDVEESLHLSEQALLLENVGTGIANVDEATSALIATLKGFNMESKETVRINDVLNEVSNNYAVTTGNLVEGIKITSATMAQNNTTLEETVALVTAATEVLQDASKASYGIKFISQRLRALDEEGNSLGEDFAPKLRQAILDIAGIDIVDAEGGLRSTYDILKDLSGVWKDLRPNQQQALATMAAGNRQVTVFNALMSNSKTLLEAVDVGLNSQGSVLEENQKYWESINGRIAIFQTTVTTMWQNIISSDFIKFIVDAGTWLINLIDRIGLVGTALLTWVTIISFTKNGWYNLGITIGKAMTSVTASLGSATAAASTFGAILNTIAPMLIVAGVVALVQTIEALIVTVDEAAESVKNGAAELEKQKSEIVSLASEYERLALMQDKSASDNKRLLEIQNEVNNKFGDGKEQLDIYTAALELNTEKINDNKNAILELDKAALDVYKTRHQRDADQFMKYLTEPSSQFDSGFMGGLFGTMGTFKDRYAKRDAILKDMQYIQEHPEQYSGTELDVLGQQFDELDKNIRTAEEGLQEFYDTIGETNPLEKLKASLQNASLATVNEAFNAKANTFKIPESDAFNKDVNDKMSAIKEVQSAYKTLSEGQQLSHDQLVKLMQQYPELAKYVANTGDLTLNQGKQLQVLLDGNIASFSAYLVQIRDSAGATDEMKDAANSLIEVLGNTDIKVNEVKNSYEEMTKKLGEYTTGINTANEANTALASGNKISRQTLFDLINTYPMIASYIASAGDLTLQNGAIIRQALNQQRLDVFNLMLAEKSRAIQAVENAKAILAAKQIEMEHGRGSGNTEFVEEYNEALEDLANKESDLDNIEAQLEAIASVPFDDATDAINGMLDSVDDLNGAMTTLAKGEKLSIKSVLSLIQKYPTLAEYLARTGDLTFQNGKMLEYMANQEIAAANAKIEGDLKMLNSALAVANAFTTQAASATGLAQALAAVGAAAQFVTMAENGATGLDIAAAIQQAINSAKAALAAIKAIRVGGGGGGGGGSRSRDETDPDEARIDIENELYDAIVSRYEKELELAEKAHQAKRKYYEEEKNNVESLKKKYNELINKQNERNSMEDLYKKRQNLLLAGKQGSSEMLALEKQIAEAEKKNENDAINDRFDAQMSYIDNMIAAEDKAFQEIQEKYQAMIEDTKAIWEQVEEIIKGGIDNVVEYLKQNSEDYAGASDTERASLIEEWRKLLQEAGIGSGGSDSGGSSKASAITKVLRQGSRGNDVKTLQRALKALGFDPKGIDGIFGKNTARALKEFQRQNGIAADGVFGPKTKAKFKAKGYSTGGMVDYTGLAIVHGTRTKPESFLNAEQTKLFKDLLNGYTGHFGGGSTGNVTVQIDIYNPLFDTAENARKTTESFKQQVGDVFKEIVNKQGLNTKVIRQR